MFGPPDRGEPLQIDQPPPHSPGRASYALWIVLFFVFATALAVVGYESAMNFSGSAMDGPFQLYDALRRIQAGYRPGVDFQFFHGMGMPFLHYGFFRLFGGGLRGSELARGLIAAAAFPAVLLVFFRVFTGDWRQTFCLSAAAIAASLTLKMSAVIFAVNGMLGVRSALPALLPVVLYLAPTRRARIIATGIAVGISLVLSTEQGLAVTVAYAVMAMIAIIRGDQRMQRLLEAVLTLVLAGATLVSCLLLLGGFSGMRGALRYNFQIVPMDQYWFFGAPPNTFVPSWGIGLRMAIGTPIIAGALLLGTVASLSYLIRLWRAPNGEPGRRNAALAVLPVYGLISCGSLLGVFTPSYAQPCWRTLLMVGGLELAAIAARSDARKKRTTWLGVPRALAGWGIALPLWALLTTPLVLAACFVSLPQILGSVVTGNEKFSISGIWPETLRDGQRVIDAHRSPSGTPPILWSTYAGWLEARNGIFNPSFDYMIHALGPENRAKYLQTFQSVQPALVQTVHPQYSQYEQWLENNDWPFYEEVLRSYAITATTPWSIFWARRSARGTGPIPIAGMNVGAGTPAVQLPPIPDSLASALTLLVIDVDYETHNPLRWVPIVGPSPRFLIGLEGAISQTPISLDPYVRHIRFPLVIRPGQTPILHFETFSLLPGASWVARSVTVSVFPVDQANQPWLSALSARALAAPK